jgi:hypothetical protein
VQSKNVEKPAKNAALALLFPRALVYHAALALEIHTYKEEAWQL